MDDGQSAHKLCFLSHLGYEPFNSLTRYSSADWQMVTRHVAKNLASSSTSTESVAMLKQVNLCNNGICLSVNVSMPECLRQSVCLSSICKNCCWQLIITVFIKHMYFQSSWEFSWEFITSEAEVTRRQSDEVSSSREEPGNQYFVVWLIK